jgi:large subunit ribosomal protein L29
MKIKDLKEKNEKELKALLVENQERLRQLRFDLSSRQLKNVKEISKVKKIIARISTLLNNTYGEQ